MIYFSGFALQNESVLFKNIIPKDPFCVCGFSYGAIKALRYALKDLQRIERVILISPAFFNDKDERFKKTQLFFFKKDPQKYIKNFFKNCSLKVDLYPFFKEPSFFELKELLYFNWQTKDLDYLRKKISILRFILDKMIKLSIPSKPFCFLKNLQLYFFIKTVIICL